MNRVQFMEQLKKLLSDISEEERQEALEYYESYFDDAGEDQEAEVIRELGSPGKVAAIIKEDLKSSSQNYGEFTENGFQDERADNERQMPQNRVDRGYHAERKGGKASVILVLILNFGMLGLIKYTNFAVENLNALFHMNLRGMEILLPLGISFYTFKSSGYILDVYWKRCKAEHNPLKYALFVSFFPQILQ